MSPVSMTQNASRWTVATLLTLLLALTYWLYQFGFSAGFQFDDASSIGRVGEVRDLSSALAYLFDGRASFLGRPLALVTFLLQKDSWPSDPAAFFMVNTLIHLVNGVLVYWLSYQLTRFFPGKVRQPAWFALAAMALWLTLPLHVSASLAAVQRMATMSSTFILLGLIGYVAGRERLDASPRQAYMLMTGSLVMGTALALLCKEIGVVLILYVLVLEATLMRAGGGSGDIRFKRWTWVFLGAPVLLLVAYFAYSWPKFMDIYAIRSFSLTERLLTEPRILWDYLGQIYLPARNGTGPYHDDYPVSTGLFDPATTAIALLAWAAAIFSAWRLRQQFPVIPFALLWFLAGHLIESGFIPLELYFEHRNYTPSVGPLLAACVLLWQVPVKIRRVALAGLVLMVLLRLFILGETTRMWGQPLLAASMWAEEHPQSARAAQFLARVYFYAGDQNAMRQATLDGHARIGSDVGLALQSVYLSCPHDDAATFLARSQEIRPALSGGTGGVSAPELLNKMLEAQQQGACPHLTLDQLFGITDALLANPHNQAAPGIMAALHIFKYRLYALQGKPNLSIRELFTAFSFKRELLIAVATARVTADAGRYDEALAFLDKAMSFAPGNPILKLRWKTEFDQLKVSIEQKRAAALPGK